MEYIFRHTYWAFFVLYLYLFYSFEKPKQRRKHWAVFLSVDLGLIPFYPYLGDPSQGCMQIKKWFEMAFDMCTYCTFSTFLEAKRSIGPDK